MPSDTDNLLYSKCLPLRLCSGNIRGHWSKRYAVDKKARMIVKMQCSDIKDLPLPCIITITRHAPKMMDYDNFVFSCKSVVDAIADLLIPGLAPGRADGDKRLKFKYEQVKSTKKQYFVWIDINKTFANIPNECYI